MFLSIFGLFIRKAPLFHSEISEREVPRSSLPASFQYSENLTYAIETRDGIFGDIL